MITHTRRHGDASYDQVTEPPYQRGKAVIQSIEMRVFQVEIIDGYFYVYPCLLTSPTLMGLALPGNEPFLKKIEHQCRQDSQSRGDNQSRIHLHHIKYGPRTPDKIAQT